MNFSVTEDGSFQRCERKAFLTSKNGMHLTPLSTPLAFATGTMWHRAHQLWITNPNTNLHEHALMAATESLEATKRAYLKRVNVSASEEQLSGVYEAADFVIAMCDNYAIKYADPIPPGYRFISAEQKIVVTIPETRQQCPTCEFWMNRSECPECGGTGEIVHNLEGRVDALLQHIATGRYDVLERKSYKTRPKELGLRTNAQFLGYIYLVDQLGISPSMPHTLYDGAWRRKDIPRGRTFDDLFLRLDLSRNQHEYEEYARWLPARLNRMAQVYQAGLEAANAHRPWQGCYDCNLDGDKGKGLCTAISRGEDYRFIIKYNYTERTDDSEEPEEVEE